MADQKRLVKDPEAFLGALEAELDAHVTRVLGERTEEWSARNPAGVVSGSTLATCMRQAWYRRYQAGSAIHPSDDEATQHALWLGFVFEELLGGLLEAIPGKLHKEQNEFPVHLVHPDTSLATLSGTTDFVKEVEVEGKSYYIPIEVKSTQRYNWQTFEYEERHLHQLMLWIYYAKIQKLNVPYGILYYIQRSSFRRKWVVVLVDTVFRRYEKNVIDFDLYAPYMEKKIQTLLHHLETNTLPSFPKSIPKYICQSCTFLDWCYTNYNPVGKEASSNGKQAKE